MRNRRRGGKNLSALGTFNPELQYMHARLGRGHHEVLNGDQMVKWPMRRIKIRDLGGLGFLFFLSPGELAELTSWILHSVPASTKGAVMVCCTLGKRFQTTLKSSPLLSDFSMQQPPKTVEHPEYNCLWC